MIDNISFVHQEWVWLVSTCSILLWGLFLWKELRVSGTKNVMLKALAAFIAVGALAVMILQPVQAVTRAKGVGVILTTSYKQQQVDSLQALHKGLVVLTYENDGLKKSQLDSINTAYVLGNGIAAYDLWQLEGVATTYLGGENITGVTALTYDTAPTVGDVLEVHGMYSAPIKDGQLVLQDAAGNGLDSIQFSSNTSLEFGLSTTPTVRGRYVYRLVEKDSLATVVSVNPLPVEVRDKVSLRVLIVNTFPTFETKYLKNFLADKGHEVLVRSQLTKDTYKFENFNRKQATIYGFTAQNLSAFDVVMIDNGSYNALSRASRRALNRQVAQGGLGVFILPDASVVNDGKRFGFRFKRNTLKETSLTAWPNVKIPTLLATISTGALMQSVISSEGNVWTAYTQQGAGRWTSSTLTDTYQLVLDGNEAAYEYLWTTTLRAVSQKKLPVVHWEFQEALGEKDAPFRFKLRTKFPNPKVTDREAIKLPLRQGVSLPDQWEGIVYPQQTGWSQLHIEQDSTATTSYYIAQDEEWPSLKATHVVSQNRRTFTSDEVSTEVRDFKQPVRRLWFFIAFILAIGYLWVTPRVNGM